MLIEAKKKKAKMKLVLGGKSSSVWTQKAYEITMEETLCFTKANAVGYFKALQGNTVDYLP